ncbi:MULTISPECIES: carboxyltransferase domain-containing protein [Bradyrhizobium]|uniref:Carboxyltransferase domain-containing protein n=2 Tax=Bradyrhizobium TaxID=374 RepID=A0AAE5X9U8_9BRAD|nr:hypothetical protein X265_39470 [Bradyrhizobium guangdongense]QAU51171.1 hypothetical protein XH91_38670 [Bradyrhizobium guangzhouense]QOZ49243.1 hypothetical protein XH89_37590 [Bradyrhizobium sp. CCBAU 53340]QOZ57049.1 hypothetical protein XH90_38030 [Bradyrhizobium sp. CCBAU 53338]QOZ81004.1 hypothetical protein XH83_36540 [Bradyrhizobium sp. CCBAU 53351]
MCAKLVVLDAPRVSHCGASALLLDAEGPLSLQTQQRIWALDRTVRNWQEVTDAQVGLNSLLIVVDPLTTDTEPLAMRFLAEWNGTTAWSGNGRTLEIGIVYGGAAGRHLREVADRLGVSPSRVAELHSAGNYTVFAPGTGPGFGFLFGLDRRLHLPRRPEPQMVPNGPNLSMAGAQTSLGPPLKPGEEPSLVPSGWYALGHAPASPIPFDFSKTPPNVLDLGDCIRFRIERVET